MAEPGQAPAGRAPWGTISRENIVQAALRIVTADGYEDLSIRKLAASLGVAPMSLYRHIRDKDDLLDEVVDRLLADVWRPAAAEDDWQAWTTEAASRLRCFLVSQPAALHVYLSRPVASPAAVDRMNAMMRVLRRTGIGEETARSAYGSVHTYTIGFAALEASRARWNPGDRDADGVARHLAAYTTTGQFVDGLCYLLKGISGNPEATQPSGQLPEQPERRSAMVSSGQVIGFTLVALVLIVVPGPGVLFVVGRALSHGRRTAVATAAGHAAGNLVVAVCVAYGLGALLQRSAEVFTAVKLAGALYLVFLGVQAVRRRHSLAAAMSSATGTGDSWKALRDGVVVGVTNPKGYVLFGAILPQFVNRAAGHVPAQMLALALISVTMGLVSDSVWGLAASAVRAWFARSPRRFALVGGAGGLAMIGVGITIALTGRKD